MMNLKLLSFVKKFIAIFFSSGRKKVMEKVEKAVHLLLFDLSPLSSSCQNGQMFYTAYSRQDHVPLTSLFPNLEGFFFAVPFCFSYKLVSLQSHFFPITAGSEVVLSRVRYTCSLTLF
jgi:hypothetical protein